MIETNAFFVLFAVLILTVSVMHMVVLTRFVRLKMAAIPDEYFERLAPTVGREKSVRIFIVRYRLAQSVLALLGVLLLVWLANYMQRPDWDNRWVVFPVVVYFVLQWVPMLFTAMAGIKHMKVLKSFLLHTKRRATLQRRGLFDFVSPGIVCVSAAVYLLFVAFAIYASRDLASRLLFIGAVTLNYALTVFSLYRMLYGKKSDPFESHEGRLYTIGLRARSSIYSSTAIALFMAFTIAMIQLHVDRWMPAGLAGFLTIATFITFSAFVAPPRQFEVDEASPTGAAS